MLKRLKTSTRWGFESFEHMVTNKFLCRTTSKNWEWLDENWRCPRMPQTPSGQQHITLKIIKQPEKRRLLPKQKKTPCGTIQARAITSHHTIIRIKRNSSTIFQGPTARQSRPSPGFFSRLDKRQSFALHRQSPKSSLGRTPAASISQFVL